MREHVIAQGTIKNTLYAQQYGVSMNIAGGTHHAFRDRPGAFCMLHRIHSRRQSVVAHW